MALPTPSDVTVEAWTALGTLGSATPATNVFGISEPHADLPRVAGLIAETGIKWVRAEIYWSKVEAVEGVYNWELYDRMIQTYVDLGINVQAILSYMPDTSRFADWSEAATAFQAFASAAVARYAPLGVHYWEMFNEPNLTGYGWLPAAEVAADNLKGYLMLLAAGNVAVRANDPLGLVIIGGLASDDARGVTAETAMSLFYSLGGKNCFDIMAFHPYGYQGTFDTAKTRIAAILTAGSDTKPVWFNEYGWTGYDTMNLRTDPTLTTNQMIKAYSQRAEADALFWFSGTDYSRSWGTPTFGLASYWGAKRPSFATMQALTALVAPTLNAVSLSAATVTASAPAGTTVGTIVGKTIGSTLSLIDDAGGMFALSGGTIVVGLTALTAGAKSITIRETLAGATNTPRDTVLSVTVSAAPVLDPLPRTLVSSLTYRGQTAYFSPSVNLGYDATGRPIIITDREIRLTGFSTPSTADKHGAMRRPRATDNSTSKQGWDTIIGSNPVSGSGKIAYDPALNVDPGKTGVDFVVAMGARDSIVKSVRRTDTATYQQCNPFMTIMFLPEEDCFDGMIAPGPSDPDGTIYNSADVDLTVFRTLSKPSGFPTVAQIMALDEEAWPYYGWSGENLRRIQTAGVAWSENYSGNIAQYTSQLLYAGHYADNDPDRRTIALALIRHGLDIDAAVTGAGWPGLRGAGQGHIHAQPHYAAAFLLGSSAMLARAVGTQSNAFSHPTINGPELEGIFVQFPSSVGQKSHYQRTFYADDIGKPWWSESSRGSQPSARYSTQALVPDIYEAFPVLLLQNGPSGETGAAAALNGPNDSSNPRRALLQIYDRIKSWPDKSRSFSTTSPTSFSYEDAIAAWRSNITGFGYTGTPDTYDRSDAGKQNFTTSVAGGFSWAIPGTEYTGNQTITEVGVEYSLDGVQFIDTGVTTLTGSKTGLMRGIEHIGRFRQKNASGWGAYSESYPMATGSSDVPTVNRHRFTPSGTETAAAPVVTVAPKLFKRKYPRWGALVYEEVSGTLASDEVTLTIGKGYCSGYPAPTYAFKWQRNDGSEGSPTWVDVAATQEFTYTLAETGKQIRGGFQPTNASGSAAWVYTSPVSVPVAPSLPAGVHVDLNFEATDYVYYPTIFSECVVANGTEVRQPVTEYGIDGEDEFIPLATSPGAYCVNKTATNPNVGFRLGNFPAGTYRILTHAAVGYDYTGTGADYTVGRGHEIRVMNQLNYVGATKFIYDGGPGQGTRFPSNDPGVPYLIVFDRTFTLASASDVWVTHLNFSNAAGSAGGDVVVTRLLFEDA